MKEDYWKFSSQMNTIHASAAGHEYVNGDFFLKETESSKNKSDPLIVLDSSLNFKSTHLI